MERFLRFGFKLRSLRGTAGSRSLQRDCDSYCWRFSSIGFGDCNFSNYDYSAVHQHSAEFDAAIHCRCSGELVFLMRIDFELRVVYRIWSPWRLHYHCRRRIGNCLHCNRYRYDQQPGGAPGYSCESVVGGGAGSAVLLRRSGDMVSFVRFHHQLRYLYGSAG